MKFDPVWRDTELGEAARDVWSTMPGEDYVDNTTPANITNVEATRGMEEVKGSIPCSSTPKTQVDRVGLLCTLGLVWDGEFADTFPFYVPHAVASCARMSHVVAA